MTIKQSTIEAIQESKNINVTFDKYGSKTKISVTYYDTEHAYTTVCYATISFNKNLRLSSYADLVDILKPTEFSCTRTNKLTGDDTIHSDEQKVKLVFKALCTELATRTENVYLDMYQSFSKKK